MPTLPCRKRPPSHTNGTIPSKTTTKRTPHSYGLSRLSATGGVFFYSASEKFFPRSAPPSIKAASQSLLNPRTPHHLLRLPRVHRRVSCVSCVSRIASAAFPIFGFFFKTRLRGRQATARPQRLRFLRQTLKMEQVHFGLPFGSDLGGSLAFRLPEGAAVTRIGAACGADNPRSSDVDAD